MHSSILRFVAGAICLFLLLFEPSSLGQLTGLPQTNQPLSSATSQKRSEVADSETGRLGDISWRDGMHRRILGTTKYRTLLISFLVLLQLHIMRKSIVSFMYSSGGLDLTRASRAWCLGLGVGVSTTLLFWGFARWWALFILIPLATLFTNAALRSRPQGRDLDRRIGKQLDEKNRDRR